MILCRNDPAHQKHHLQDDKKLVGYSCEEVIIQEKKYGPHIDGCPHVGYLASIKCCQKDKK